MRLRVEVVSEEWPDGPDATLRVDVRDVSEADAASTTVAGTEVALPSGLAAGAAVSVELDLPDGALAPRRDHVVWAHLDVDGDGAVSVGDRITTRAHPVDSGWLGSQHPLPVRLEAVR